ncbi:MAG: biotin--[Clostridia bacterium]|nr:biotin--[acetyl-CoA-carboxylase] ligase [Clostridia bacterium]
MKKEKSKDISSIINPKTDKIGSCILCYDAVSSTNDIAKHGNFKDGTVIIANTQTSGKGRNGKVWQSDTNGIWMSILLCSNTNAKRVYQTSLASGIAVCTTLNEMFNLDAKIKWPNDIVCKDKKICGILTELVTKQNIVKKIIVGIGINVNTKRFPGNISEIAVSLYMLTGTEHSHNELIGRILENFEKYYKIMIDGDIQRIIEIYKKNCVNIGKKVIALYNGKEIIGTAADISPIGELIISLDNGQKITVNSGEVSIRGFYGYV